MKGNLRVSLVGSVCLVVALPALAADGAIPIWGPTTITQPGSYVVTQDITAAGLAIEISSDDVTLDLNGFTVQSSANAALRLSSVRKNVTIRDGVIKGWSYGVYVEDGTNVDISRNRIDASGYGIRISAGSGSTIHRNVLHVDENATAAVYLQSATNIEISENTMTCINVGNFTDGLRAGGSYDTLIRDNRIRDCAFRGIEVGHQSLVRNNAISGELFASYAIEVAGDYNQIEGNLMTNHWRGLYLSGDFNVYRRNTARGNASADFFDVGVGNTSHGDNYMPNQM